MSQCDLAKFPKLQPRIFKTLDDILEKELPKLMETLTTVEAEEGENGDVETNPFSLIDTGAEAAVTGNKGWVIGNAEKIGYDSKFHEFSLVKGKASSTQIMAVMKATGYSHEILKQIWDLADIDRDGKMDHDEFATCMYLIDMLKGGNKLPPTLPMRLIPPSKRNLLEFSN